MTLTMGTILSLWVTVLMINIMIVHTGRGAGNEEAWLIPSVSRIPTNFGKTLMEESQMK